MNKTLNLVEKQVKSQAHEFDSQLNMLKAGMEQEMKLMLSDFSLKIKNIMSKSFDNHDKRLTNLEDFMTKSALMISNPSVFTQSPTLPQRSKMFSEEIRSPQVSGCLCSNFT